jgi:hypothetical protein
MRIELNHHSTINAPAQEVWRVLAHEFGSIGQWASSIPESQGVTDIPAPDGAVVAGRVCATAVPGFGAVREIFTYYDEQSMRFAYKPTTGRPWYIKRAENHCAVRSLGPQLALVESRAELELPLFPGLAFAPLLKLSIGHVATQFFEELKHYVEQGQPHPRKLRAL